MSESHAVIQDLQVSVSRAQEDVKYWEREASRWKFIAENYFQLWYTDIQGGIPATKEQTDHEMIFFYKENFEDN